MIGLPYREIWAVDFEFAAQSGERQEPACLVAMELRSGRTIRLWRDQFGPVPPYPLDAGSLFVSFYASAELCCHRALGWGMPERALDLFTEFRDRTNGMRALDGGFQKASLLEAMSYFGLAHLAPSEKAAMRDKFIAGNFDAWTPEEIREGLDYCQTDVDALAVLLPAMLPGIDLHRALIRGAKPIGTGSVRWTAAIGIEPQTHISPHQRTFGRHPQVRRVICGRGVRAVRRDRLRRKRGFES